MRFTQPSSSHPNREDRGSRQKVGPMPTLMEYPMPLILDERNPGWMHSCSMSSICCAGSYPWRWDRLPHFSGAVLDPAPGRWVGRNRIWPAFWSPILWQVGGVVLQRFQRLSKTEPVATVEN